MRGLMWTKIGQVWLLKIIDYWEDSFGMKSILKCSWGLEAYII